jgi:DNA-binding beta-propeller fold protein YncE
MRSHGFLITIALAALAAGASPSKAATFGTVVPIGGHASDIVLDEARSVLYIANLTANRIEVMSTADYSIRSSMNVAAQPGSISLSPDNQFLLVTHLGNFTTPSTSRNAVTLINLNDGTRQTFAMGDPPLAASFIADGRAFIVTTTSMLLFDPVSGAIDVVTTFPALATTLPVPVGTIPSAVLRASIATSPDRKHVFGLADDGGFQAFYKFDTTKGEVYALGVVAVPRPLPRIGVSADGNVGDGRTV